MGCIAVVALIVTIICAITTNWLAAMFFLLLAWFFLSVSRWWD